MALFKEIMQGGVSAGTARALQGQVSSSLTAAGSSISDATQLSKSINNVTTVTSGQGVKLPIMAPGESVIVYNQGSAEVIVYPGASTIKINLLALGGGVTLAMNSSAEFHGISSTQVLVR